MNKFKEMSNEYLRINYVPDVYQPSIYSIDYQKLKEAGIKLISFDIDDTVAALEENNPSKEAKVLFENLKNMGFEVVLLSNTKFYERGANFAEKLGIDGKYIAQAEKPLTKNFAKLLEQYGLDKSQMAHVGNSMRDDVAGGNASGVTTCLIRRVGVVSGLINKVPLVKTQGQELRKELKKRGIWRKHHKYQENDQYYQLGETPAYRSTL